MAEGRHRGYSSDSDDDVKGKQTSEPSLSKAQLSGLPSFKRKRAGKEEGAKKETEVSEPCVNDSQKSQDSNEVDRPRNEESQVESEDQDTANQKEQNSGQATTSVTEKEDTSVEPVSLPAQKKRKLPSSRRTAEERRQEREQYEQREKLAMERARMEAGRRSNEAIVRSHYNALPEYGRERRLESPIIQLRNYNNLIKSVLIRKFGSEANSVLDVGCGKGGDLLKWSKTRVRHYIGVDIAEISIQQARERYNSMRRKPFRSDFFVGDAFHSDIKTIVPAQMFPVDVVSMMFCMHYAFETEEMARRTLENISQSLHRGGMLIGTIPSSDTIIENIEKLEPEEKGWKNSIYRVEFVDNPSREGVFRPPFGHKYRFYLQDAVGDVPEYVVPFEAFRALAEDYNLSLIYRENFHAVFDEEVTPESDFYDLCRRLNVSKSDGTFGIEGDQREAAGFYLAFAFEKLGNS